MSSETFSESIVQFFIFILKGSLHHHIGDRIYIDSYKDMICFPSYLIMIHYTGVGKSRFTAFSMQNIVDKAIIIIITMFLCFFHMNTHPNIEIPCPCRIIKNCDMFQVGKWKEGQYYIARTMHVLVFMPFPSSLFVAVPNCITFCMHRYKTSKYQASCILENTREWLHVIFLACDSFTFYISFYI